MATASVLPDDTIPAISDMAEPRAEVEHEQVGPYELLSELAQGGMGRVYLARERGEGGYNRLVALKRIHDHLASQKAFVDMFLDEARIASQIQHPHVCTVFDFGRADDSYFISMEYLRGLPLSDVLRQLGTQPPEASPRRYAFAAHLLAQACEGLHAAHELRNDRGELLQVVHRDVSPHNLFVSFDGTLRVLDFGIARAINRIAESTTGRVKGKFAYMAPEQALGRRTDRRSDVFSVGVVLWEFCTLQRLFKRDSPAETILQVVHEETPSPSSYVADVPPELERICMRALSKEPTDRFASARQMGRALSRAAAALGPPITAGDVEEWMGQLFPGASDRSLSALEPHTAGLSIAPAEVTGLRAKTPPAVSTARTRAAAPAPSKRRGVPALVAISSAVLAAAIAFVVARVTQPGPAPQRLPSTVSARPDSEPTAPDDFESPADLVFDAPADDLPDDSVPEEPSAPESEPPPPSRAPRQRRGTGSTARRARHRESAPAASTATGRVRVGGPPSMWDAPIVFRGRRLGVVPDTIELPVGAQAIEIRVPGRAPVRRRVQVRVGQVTRVTIR